MDTIPSEYLYAAIGLIAGISLASLFFLRRVLKLERQNAELTVQIKAEKIALEQAGASLDNRFKATAQEALKASNDQFLQLAQERLKAAQADSAHDLDKRQKAIDMMVTPMQERLAELGKALQQAKGTDEALREDLKSLSAETAKLVGALKNPAAQGQWGEYILEGLLEKSGLLKGVHYETQVSMTTETGRQQPDAVINMQDGFHIIIDAKAPINEFANRLSEDLNEQDYQNIMSGMARQVRSHVKELSKKGYWENVESPDFTVLFLPSENLYSIALRGDPELIDFASKHNIVIASPTLLMSLLRVVGMSWRQVELAKNAQEISTLGSELYKRILTFTSHIEKIGKNLQTAMNGYDSAIGSLEKSVLPSARKMHELQGKADKDLQTLDPIERTPRLISLTEEDETEKKRA